MRHWRIIGLAVLVIVVAACLMHFTLHCKRITTVSYTDVDLSALSKAAVAYAMEYGQPLRLSSYGDISTYNSNCIAILVNRNFLTVDAHRMENGQYVDIWGTPYHIMVDEDEDGIIRLASGKEVSASVIVWSSGRDCVNEYGAGDDKAMMRHLKQEH